jgi:selenium-binding protein 1
MGFTDDRRFLWAGGLSDSKIYVFDIATDPAKPKLARTIADLGERTGYLGPHTYYALPGRMLVQALSNTKDKGGVTGMAVYNNKGEYITSYAMPTEGGGDGYGYDLAVNPKKNVLLTSSFTGYTNYMRPLGELVNDAEAMKRFGATMAAWDLKAMKPTKIFSVPGAPLENRWSLAPADNWAVTATALTSKIWLVKQDTAGEWQAKDVATIGDPAKIPLPVDISITRDGKGLWVNTFMDGTTRYFDLSNPEAPKQTYSKVTGKQVNMISQSWDGKRVYITSSLLANWDKGGADNEQFLRGFTWNGVELTPAFEVDFTKEKLGRAHHMKLGAKSLRAGP